MELNKIPLTTYRLQFHKGFTFQDACSQIDYLHDLGITHIYASPIWKAIAGSMHGYDLVDHSMLNPELGSYEDFEAFIEKLHEKSMGLIVDIVPNHMFAVDSRTAWWKDVLENGPSSEYAGFFDIDFSPLRKELKDKVLLPILDRQFGTALEDQTLQICFENGSFELQFLDCTLPTDPGSWYKLLEPIAKEYSIAVADDHPDLLELKSIATQSKNLPPTTEEDPERQVERRREKEMIKKRLLALFGQNDALLEVALTYLRFFNGKKNHARSFDALEAFLDCQPYRLSYWRVANNEINYRRFFDIFSLAGISMEKKQVFEKVHTLLFDLIAKGFVDGVRIDHIDGLLDPKKYLYDLQEAIQEKLGTKKLFWIVGEKILTGAEKLRETWPCAGTVGYDFLNYVQGLFIDGKNKKEIISFYKEFTGREENISDGLFYAKQEILRYSLSSELFVLAKLLDQIAQGDRSSRDYTLESLKDALIAVISSFPVYRSYIDPEKEEITDEDRHAICVSIQRAKRYSLELGTTIFDFIQSLLLLKYPQGLKDEVVAKRQEFVRRFQQLTSPVMAKGCEDTHFYRWMPLVALNEVGADPYSFATSTEKFYEKCIERLQWPYTMNTTSTHDTKRSEDVRARIAVLSEIPDLWKTTCLKWHAMQNSAEIDPNDLYLLYQTVVGACPDTIDETFKERIKQYMLKAVKESKVHTNWINPDSDYETMLTDYIERLLSDANFCSDLKQFCQKIIIAGLQNSLSQVVLKSFSPGVCDIYQGNERLVLTLVDPDNRQLVEYKKTDEIKYFVTKKCLAKRKEYASLLLDGDFIPIEVDHDQVIAFRRKLDGRSLIVVSLRFFYNVTLESFSPVTITLDGTYQDIFTDRVYQKGELSVATLLSQHPFAVLEEYA